MDRSVMYKSKSGNHLSKVVKKDIDKGDRHRNRRDKRQTAYFENRIIEATPAKSLKNDIPISNIIDENSKTENENISSVQSNLSRQQAFREKFKRYLTQRAVEKQAKSNAKPFVSAVAKGRFVDISLQKDKANKKTKEVKPATVVVPNKCSTKFSPINTRSKKRTLLSPSQLPTPRRKSKSKDLPSKKDVIKKSIPPKPINRMNKAIAKTTASSKVIKPPIKSNLVKKIGLINKDPISKDPISKDPISKENKKIPNGFLKPKLNRPKVIVQSKPNVQSSKEDKKSVSVLTEQCVFSPNFIHTVTSTIVRTKKSITNKSSSLFDESFSPIEDVLSENRARTPINIDKKSETKAKFEFMGTPSLLDVSSGNGLNYVSPYVTISRGSRLSNHKEKEARNLKYSLESRKSLNDSIKNRQHKEAATYFYLQAEREIDRFNGMINTWKEKVNNDSIPSEYEDLINAAIGQTTLLITSKIKQFTDLVKQCENCDGDQKITPEDLEGFWSMVYLQVEHCNERFKRLNVLADNNWVDPELDNVKEKKIQTKNAMVKKAKQPKRQVSSALVAMLKEARKKMKEKEHQGENIDSVVRRSSAFASHTPRKTITPRKSPWIVEDSISNLQSTPMRGILKTPGSIRKTPRNTLKFKSSPQIKIIDYDLK